MVLLVIFMVTTPMILQGGIRISLPQAKAVTDETLQKTIIVGVSSSGRTYLNSTEVADPEMLSQKLKNMLAASSEKTVIIEGDKAAFHGRIVEVMSIAKAAGAEKLSISTVPFDEKKDK